MKRNIFYHLSFCLAAILALCAGAFGQGTYSSIQIGFLNPFYVDVDTIVLHPTDTAFPVLGTRAQRIDDSTVWEAVTSEWSSDSNPVWGPYPPQINGTGWIYARLNDSGTVLMDSVYVIMPPLPYDSLRITLRDPVTGLDTVQIQGSPPIYTMLPGESQTFYVQARRAVLNSWENVQGSWGSPAGLLSHWYRFSAVDTGHFNLSVFFDSLSAAIQIAVTAGPPAFLVFYSDSLPPGAGNAPKPNPPQIVTMAAGSTDTLAALVFDNRGVFLPEYLIGPERLSITWAVEGLAVRDTLDRLLTGADGPTKYFAPVHDYSKVLIIASLNNTIRDTVQVQVFLAVPSNDHLIIEANSIYDPYNSNPCDTLFIPGDKQSASMYAITRDTFGNFIAYAKIESWYSADTTVVGIMQGDTAVGQGIVYRKADSGITMVYGVDRSGKVDSCVVVLLPHTAVKNDKIVTSHFDAWSVFSDNGRVRIHLPAQGTYNIKIYSLAGHLVDSRATSQGDVTFRLPTGVYIVSVGQAGSRQETRKRVVAIGR
jgi:hypothetical protein